MAPVPISGGHLLYDSIDHAINAGKESLTPKDTTSGRGGRGGWVSGHLAKAYSDWSPPEPRLFEDANIREVGEWAKFIESLFAVDSWVEGDSWPSDEDTFIKTGFLAEFENTGDGVISDTPNLAIPRDDWWDLPRASEPKNPMPLGYQKSSSSVMTGRPKVPIDITTTQDGIIAPRLRTRPESSTYTTHDFGIWPRETIVTPTQYDPKRVVREYNDWDWFLTKRWVSPATADIGLTLGTCDSCDVTCQQASLVAAVGGVAVVILGLKIWKIRAGWRACKSNCVRV